MLPKTHPMLIKKVYNAIGRNHVVHHDPTATNPLGQSGLHTMVNDILDIVDATEPGMRHRAICRYFTHQ